MILRSGEYVNCNIYLVVTEAYYVLENAWDSHSEMSCKISHWQIPPLTSPLSFQVVLQRLRMGRLQAQAMFLAGEGSYAAVILSQL